MKIKSRLISIACFILTATHPLYAGNELIIQDGISVSKTLAGQVEFQQTQEPIEGVTVQLFSAGWRTVLGLTKTDKTGHFALKPQSDQTLYYLQFSSLGMNSYRLRVRLKRSTSKSIIIHMTVAT